MHVYLFIHDYFIYSIHSIITVNRRYRAIINIYLKISYLF